MILDIALIVASTLLGGVAYRMHGGWLGVPKLFSRLGLVAPLVGPLFLVAPWYWVVAAGVCTFGAISKGHGSGIDMGHNPADDPDELWRYAWAPKDSYLGDTKFMAVSGLLFTLPPGVLAGVFLAPWGFALILAGAVKGLCYNLSWKLSERGLVDQATVVAEISTGALVALSGSMVWLFV